MKNEKELFATLTGVMALAYLLKEKASVSEDGELSEFCQFVSEIIRRLLKDCAKEQGVPQKEFRDKTADIVLEIHEALEDGSVKAIKLLEILGIGKDD